MFAWRHWNSVRTLLKRRLVGAKTNRAQGVTLVEILVAMALMGFVMLSITNFVINSNVRSASLNGRFKIASDIHIVVQDIQADLHRGAYISPNSFRNRLEYTTYDPGTGDAVKKVYGICYYSSVQTTSTDTTCPLQGAGGTYPYLKLSTDAGTTWGSPYRLSGFNKYRLVNASGPKFLYAHPSNSCFDYVDDNGNGVLGAGDTTQNAVSCSANSYFGVTTSSRTPTKSTKVVLANFNFTTGSGNPEIQRNLPQYIFIAIAPGLVRSNTAAVGAGVKDSQLVQSFSTNPAVNPLYPTGFRLRGLAWDRQHEQLFLTSDQNSVLFQTERNGVFINQMMSFADANLTVDRLALEDDGRTLLVGDYNGSNDVYYRFTINDQPILSPTTGAITMSATEANRRAIVYDPNTPDYFYAPGTDSGVYKIVQYNKYTAARTATEWILPAAFSGTSYISGMTIDPVTGAFYVVLNNIYTSGGNNYLDVYRIPRAGAIPTTANFSINLTDLGTATTGSNAWPQIALDAPMNRLFLSDMTANRVYEIAPTKLLSPRGSGMSASYP